MIICASPSYAGPSGVTTLTENCLRSAIPTAARSGCGGRHLLRPLDRALDRADHVEGLLGQLVVEPFEDLVEAADRVLELHVLPGRAGELLGDEVRLRQEALDLARALHDEAVL